MPRDNKIVYDNTTMGYKEMVYINAITDLNKKNGSKATSIKQFKKKQKHEM